MTSQVQTLDNWIPQGYRPQSNISQVTSHSSPIITARIDGAIGYHSIVGNVNAQLKGLFYWRK